MQGNIVKKQISSNEISDLYDIFLPTNVYTGDTLTGKSIGRKKCFKIMGIEPEGQKQIKLNADEEAYTFDTELYGFINAADVMCGDYIEVDNVENKVLFHKTIHQINMADYLNYIGLNKIYDTHSTFQFNTYNTGYKKKPGISNLYCPDMITHKLSSSTLYDTGIAGIDNTSGYVYFKFKADDENFYLNGERITTLEMFKEWILLNPIKLYYEMNEEIVTDISNTYPGKILLGINPMKDFSWTLENMFGELTVYASIDDVLSELRAMILE